jgi:hypothetical protein
MKKFTEYYYIFFILFFCSGQNFTEFDHFRQKNCLWADVEQKLVDWSVNTAKGTLVQKVIDGYGI